ncbi:hypothetical protein JOM56_009624 [Amanita muscaria]
MPAQLSKVPELRSRRAKTDALNNAVWKQLAPGAGKKRAASTSPQRKAVRKKARKNNNKDVVDATAKSCEQSQTPNGIANTSVSIHLPGAPKKKPMATKGGKAPLASKSYQKGKKDDPVIAAEIETDKEDASVSTESIFSSDSEEDGDDDDDIVSVNDVMETGHQTQSAADKRFANEIKQPVWSDQTVGNTTKESARQSLVGDSDKENDVNSQPRKTLLIRGQVIEITDEEDQNDLDESPSARLVPPSSRPSGGETLSDMGGRGTIWPFYTDLVKGNRDLVLNVQSHELKLIIRKAIDLIEERMRFLNAFPDFVLRTVWHRAALIEACTIIHDMVHANDRYDIIKERMRVDVDYVGEIAKSLLDPRISILRGNTKILAVNNTRASFGLQDGCSQQVNRLLIGSHYIYPPAANGVGLQLNKPFENKAIIGTLHEDLFSGSNSITLKFPLRFRPTDTEPDPNKLAPATIALAATTVFASLKEWENGRAATRTRVGRVNGYRQRVRGAGPSAF